MRRAFASRVFGFLSLMAVLVLLCLALPVGAQAATGEGFRLNLDDPAVKARPLPPGGALAADPATSQTALTVTVAPERVPEANVMTIPVDLRPCRDTRLIVSGQVKAEGVSAPAKNWFGVKCMLHFKSASMGEQWFNADGISGSFDWRPLSCVAVIPADVRDGELVLGLQGCSGTVWIKDVQWRVLQARPVRPPLPPEPAAGPPAEKEPGHPRLRGVMSPMEFHEEDFAELARWNVNLIRWQMTRNWGLSGTDRDQAEYDHWLEGELDDLARALAAARRYGLKVVVDLHSPPGGREPDKTLTMLLDRNYQAQFIRNWEKIARRFKGEAAIWAYDLINEPVQNQLSPGGVRDWYGVQVEAARAIRAIDPQTAICIAADGWDSPDHYAWLMPVDLPNIIYEVHLYWPIAYTHQYVFEDWTGSGPPPLLSYPGLVDGQRIDKDALRRQLAPVREFQRAYNVPIYVGEFSAIRWAPGADRYLADCIELFEEYGWDWSYHAFREWPGFSVEHADAPLDRANHPRASEPTARAKVLLKWFAQNQRLAPPAQP